MIDLHCHFLPGIDDGARNLDEALTLARATVDNGVRCAIMTPHLHPGRWENFAGEIERHTVEFRRALADADIPLRVGYAAEVRLSPEIPVLIERGHVPFLGELNGYRFMLLEFPHGHIPLGADKLVWRLLQMKVRPVIAHPERNKDVMRDPGKIMPFVEMGCILQLTAASVCGRFGDRAHRTARILLESDADMVLATDAHNREARPPVLREGVVAAAQVVGEDRARAMAFTLPQKIVASQFSSEAKALRKTDTLAKQERPVVKVAEASRPAPTGTEQPAPPREEQVEPAATESPASTTGLEDLLIRLIDQRLRQMLSQVQGAPSAANGAEQAQQYHRELVRRLGGEIYRRVRREVLQEVSREFGVRDSDAGDGRQAGP